MPGKFKHEEVSAVPRGYRVRTVRRGRHEIRVAFPPGRRRQGAGRVVSILHPVGENPSCPIRRIASQLANPGECKCGSGEPATFGGMCPRCAREKAKLARERAGKIREARINHPGPQKNQSSVHSFAVSLGYPYLRGEGRVAKDGHTWLSRVTKKADGSGPALFVGWNGRKYIVEKGESNPSIVDSIRAGDKVTILTPHGSKLTGRAVMRSSSGGWVLNLGGRHGTPGLADERNIVRVRKGNPRDRPVAEKHQLKIARDTLKMPDAMVGVMGGPTKAQAREIIRRLTRKNPDELGQAEDLYREFHGREPREILEVQESDLARRDYTALGDVVELRFRLPDGRKLQIDFASSDKVKLASSPDGRQLYFIGGDQDIAEALAGYDVDTSRDFVDLGDAIFVSYDASKWQTDFKPTIWEHKLGEESGIQPRGFFDKLNRRIFLAGGNYRVERPGIID